MKYCSNLEAHLVCEIINQDVDSNLVYPNWSVFIQNQAAILVGEAHLLVPSAFPSDSGCLTV